MHPSDSFITGIKLKKVKMTEKVLVIIKKESRRNFKWITIELEARFLQSLDWVLPCSRLVPQIWTHQSIRLLYFRKSYQYVLNLQNREQNIKMQQIAFCEERWRTNEIPVDA